MTIDCSSVPPWLKVMRSITGLQEEPGAADNPKILGMRDWIACTYSDVPGMTKYCEGYVHDSTAWCGLCSGFCLTVAGYMPPFVQGSDTDCFLWAQSFASDPNYVRIEEPVLGAICVMTRDGGGHVTMFEGWANAGHTSYKGRGGNQSDEVNVGTFSTDDLIGFYWPADAELPEPEPEPEPEHETVQRGDTGADVEDVQHILGLPIDGEFGAQTDAAVRGWQDAVGLSSDGVVGPATWAELEALDARMSAADPNLGLDPAVAEEIVSAAKQSEINLYSWQDRGSSPPGLIAGMALCYAVAAQQLAHGNRAALVMAQAERGEPDTDALSWLKDEFDEQDMNNSTTGTATLRHLFVLLIGLSMRETSGDHWCGRDQSASNTSPDTAEAGLHQTSWDIRSASSVMPQIAQWFWDKPQGFRTVFSEGLSPSTSDLENYGNGTNGTAHQWLSKFCPAYHVMLTAVGLRTRRSHWGPVNRAEVEIKKSADDLLRHVDDLMMH